jgi:predicted dehydrogenase
VKWGILGTGSIARTFARDLPASRTGRLVAIASRNREAADAFGASAGVAPAKSYAAYADLLADAEVESVYIALPNHLHAEWTIAAAAAGKQILCEKPLTIDRAEAERVIEAVRQHGVFLMEAFMYRCHPQTARLVDVLDQGVIGQVRLIESSFSYNMGPRYENIRLSNAAAGGAIMDVGCYPVSMARLIARQEPIEVQGVAHLGERSRVDEWSAACLRFPGDLIATVAAATQVAMDQELRIWGEAGSIRVPNPWKPLAGPNRIVVQRTGQTEPETILVEGGQPLYAIEADTVAAHAGQTQATWPAMSWDDSLGNMATLDAWRRSVGLTFDAERAKSDRPPA